MIDVRADDQIAAKDAEVFEMTARACASAGWDYRRVGVLVTDLASALLSGESVLTAGGGERVASAGAGRW